jgi:hypothetical protein
MKEGYAMDLNSLNLGKGKWVMANCGKFPSEKNCRLVIMAPDSQRSDLVAAAATHAAAAHGHQNTPQLRKELDSFLDVVEI